MKNFDWKKLMPYVAAIVIFVGLSLWYCSPLMEGKVLQAGDVNNWKGASQEAREFNQQTGETTWWTNSMFGGMPTYQVTGSTPTNSFKGKLENIAHLGFSGDKMSVGIIFGYFFGFFLMLLCFGVNPWLSLIGGLAIGLSSYFFLIIPAGHITKAVALGFLAPMIGGFYAVFRKKYWLGAPLVTLYGILCVTLHPQMTYYICLLLGIMAIAELYIHISEKRWKDLGIGAGVLVICCLFIFGTKLSWWKMNQEYLNETMRGEHSELTKPDEDKSKPAGLDIDYATAWSYGKAETFTLLIPNFMGGATGYNIGDKSAVYDQMVKERIPKQTASEYCKGVPTYWGEKSFTSGPVYVGAIICFLFVLGLIIVPGPYKWALLVATVFSILLAWGKNFMPFTQFFFDHFPMYNKFRAVESILVVVEITMPLLGVLGLKRIMEAEDKKKYLRPMYIAAGITAGICLFFALFGGSVMDFTSSYDEGIKKSAWGTFYDSILDDRAAMLKTDAWRSFLFIALAFAVMMVYMRTKLKKGYVYALLGVLILADMVPVNKRFFDKENFVTKKDGDKSFAVTDWEKTILQDRSMDYRVLNLTANGGPFNDARTSYRLKSIGGYSAAKLRRYQDLIDAHISQNNWNVMNMLNTKYIVTSDGVYPNEQAFGNAWFVDSLVCVNTPDAESEALNTLDLRHVAVTDITYSANSDLNSSMVRGGQSMIQMTDYQPNKLTYKAETDSERMVVFSEIYYPHDWHLYIDGEEKPIYRVNYTLRAAMVPQGQHEIVMQFVPSALKMDKWCMAILILAIVLSLGLLCYPLYSKHLCKKAK